MSTSSARVDYASRLCASLRAHSVVEETFSRFMCLAEEQAALPIEMLYQRQSELFGPDGLFADFASQIARHGRDAPVIKDILGTRPIKRLNNAQKAAEFALSRHHQHGASPNPYGLHGRESLCCVVYDESGASTLVERYAAYEAMRRLDSDFFISLIATTRGVVERRIVFLGLLEHFDRLMPIEQSIYPGNYREVQQGHLDREEAIYGKLQLSKSLNRLLLEFSPTLLLEQVQGTTNPAS